MNLNMLLAQFADVGCDRALVKFLAPNDNSKNQVYFGPDFQAVNLLPHHPVEADGDHFKARLDFSWMSEERRLYPAPKAQLILYPQYPEVRFSGFLQGCRLAPRDLMASRDKGRVLLLGIGKADRVIGRAFGPGHPATAELAERTVADPTAALGVFHELAMDNERPGYINTLLEELGRIHDRGWIPGQRLRSDGSVHPTNAPNAGGYTLEAELGVTANSDAAPDYMGWEIKSMIVKKPGNVPSSKRITLMTPEPKGGVYQEAGVLEFVRRYGYPDKNGIPDRLNFGGQFRIGKCEPNTGLTMKLSGYSAKPGEVTGRIENSKGGIQLVDKNGLLAASWKFSDLLNHWNHKHARAAYVPAVSKVEDGRRAFLFDRTVFLGIQTDFLRFLGALNSGLIVYDPGIKVEYSSAQSPVTKRRSQFRIKFSDLNGLYDRFEPRAAKLPRTISCADVYVP